MIRINDILLFVVASFILLPFITSNSHLIESGFVPRIPMAVPVHTPAKIPAIPRSSGIRPFVYPVNYNMDTYLDNIGVNTNRFDSFNISLEFDEEQLKKIRFDAECGDAGSQYLLGNLYEYGQGVKQDYKQAFVWYKNAAKHDHAAAQFKLGSFYEDGLGVDQNKELAFEWFEKSAEQDNAAAQFKVGNFYEAGSGVRKNEELAFEWYAKAAKHNHAGAQYKLGNFYEDGRGVDKNDEIALEWYTKASDYRQHRPSKHYGIEGDFNFRITERFIDGSVSVSDIPAERLLFNNIKKSGDFIEKAVLKKNYLEAKAGDAESQYELGYYYKHCQNESNNYEKAFEWFEKAARQNHVMAQFELGTCLEKGLGVERNNEKALEWYEKAAKQKHSAALFKVNLIKAKNGDTEAQYELGNFYADGQIVEKNSFEAFKCFFKSACHGNKKAFIKLAYSLFKFIKIIACFVFIGVGIFILEKNNVFGKPIFQSSDEMGGGNCDNQYRDGLYFEKEGEIWRAVKCYKKAAAGGSVGASYKLGMCYLYGKGIEKDEIKGVNLIRKAADQGDAFAQFELGKCYSIGTGVKQNLNNAAKYFKKSAEAGYALAQLQLGICYENGLGVDKNEKDAAEMYRVAYEYGCDLALFHLGKCFLNGVGVEQNEAEGMKRIKKAATCGVKEAQDFLRQSDKK